MQVDIVLLVKTSLQTKLSCSRTGIRKCCLGRFLHHIAQLSCEGQVAAPVHQRRLDGGQIATGACPGYPCCHSHLVLVLSLPIELLLRAEVVGDPLSRYLRFGAPALRHFTCYFTHYRRYFALQVTYTGFKGVLTDDTVYGLILNLNTSGFETVFAHLFRDEELASNMQLLLFSITSQ